MKIMFIVTLLFFTTAAWTQTPDSVDKAVDNVNVDDTYGFKDTRRNSVLN